MLDLRGNDDGELRMNFKYTKDYIIWLVYVYKDLYNTWKAGGIFYNSALETTIFCCSAHGRNLLGCFDACFYLFPKRLAPLLSII